MRTNQLLLSTFSALLLLCFFGCSSEDDGDKCQTFDYAKYTAPTMPITLKDHIQPDIIKNSCALSIACHQNGSPHPPALGPMNGIVDTAALQVIAGELRRDSTQVPMRKYVVPGRPEDSYLMNKIDGTHLCSKFACVGDVGCGARMPELQPPLEAAKINMFRDWIKQGAN